MLDNDQTTTVKVRPEDPILWMADYLRDNNPNTNADAAARAAKRRRLDEEARAAEAAKPAVWPRGSPRVCVCRLNAPSERRLALACCKALETPSGHDCRWIRVDCCGLSCTCIGETLDRIGARQCNA